MQKQITDFKLTGLTKPFSMTCETKGGNIFWPKVGLYKDRFKVLFDWAKSTDDFWSNHSWVAEIEHEGLNTDGTPINPTVISIKEN